MVSKPRTRLCTALFNEEEVDLLALYMTAMRVSNKKKSPFYTCLRFICTWRVIQNDILIEIMTAM